ncbi:MAG: hypothetical protein WBE47_11695, partial [Candidatus Acidiferrales bacterium]
MSATVEYTAEVVAALADACLDFDAWQRVGKKLSSFDRRRQEFVGDWLLAGEAQHGEKCYDAAVEIFSGSYRRKSLQNMASVCKAVPASLRKEGLTYNHYAAVAKLSDADKQLWIARAAAETLSVKQLRELINPPKEKLQAIPVSSVKAGMFFVREDDAKSPLYFVTRIKNHKRPEVRSMPYGCFWWESSITAYGVKMSPFASETLVCPLTKAQVFAWNHKRFEEKISEIENEVKSASVETKAWQETKEVRKELRDGIEMVRREYSDVKVLPTNLEKDIKQVDENAVRFYL